MNREAVVLFVKHFQRDAEEAIKPPPEPLFLDLDEEPGYYSLVPNHRCFQCKDAKNHRPMDQAMIHQKLIRFRLGAALQGLSQPRDAQRDEVLREDSTPGRSWNGISGTEPPESPTAAVGGEKLAKN